jgi:hypothetical protein
MNDSTKRSDRPSLPVTRYRLLKIFAVTSCIRFDAGTSIGKLPLVAHPEFSINAGRFHPFYREEDVPLPNLARGATLARRLARQGFTETDENTS